MNEGIPTPNMPDKYEAISKAHNFEELFVALDQLGGLLGSTPRDNSPSKRHPIYHYSTQELKDRINEAIRLTKEGKNRYEREIPKASNQITRTGGLREKVTELLDQMIREAQSKDPVIFI